MVNQRKLPYDGWVEVEVSFNNESQSSVTVSFLVASENLEYPIFGKNDKVQNILPRCLPNHSSEVLDPLVHLLQPQKESSINSAKSPKHRIIIPAGTICHIKCSIYRNIMIQESLSPSNQMMHKFRKILSHFSQLS